MHRLQLKGAFCRFASISARLRRAGLSASQSEPAPHLSVQISLSHTEAEESVSQILHIMHRLQLKGAFCRFASISARLRRAGLSAAQSEPAPHLSVHISDSHTEAEGSS